MYNTRPKISVSEFENSVKFAIMRLWHLQEKSIFRLNNRYWCKEGLKCGRRYGDDKPYLFETETLVATPLHLIPEFLKKYIMQIVEIKNPSYIQNVRARSADDGLIYDMHGQ